MKQKLTLLILALFTTMGAWAEVLTLTPNNGTYVTSSGNYVNSITFSTTPTVTVTASANNMDKRLTDTYLQWHSGTSNSSTYTITVTGDYVITAYSVTGEANTSAQTLTAGSVSHEFAVGTSSSFDVTGLSTSSVSFVQTGVNASGLKITSISVTVKAITSFDPNEVAGKTFTLQCARGYVYWNGSTMKGNASNATKFAIVSYDSDNDSNNETYLYDVDNSAFVCHTTLGWTGSNGNSAVESSNDFSKAVKNISFGSTNIATYPYYIAETVYNTWLNMDGTPNVYFNKWTNFENGNGGNTYKIAVVDTDFDQTAAAAMLDAYFNPSYTVTYIVKDGSDNVLFTSEPVATTNGANITTLPAEYQLTNFYTYNTVNVTISASGNTNVEFTATPKAEPLVKYTADTSNPYYYNLNIRSQYLVYNSEATGQVTLQSTSEPFNANASWAFIGEPYAGFKVINKTKGTDYFLTYTSVVTGGNSGKNNIQFVEAGEFNNRYWIVDKNTGGFCLRMKENTNIYFHHDNTHKLLRTCSTTEWSAVHNDAGSTLVASTDEDVLIALYNELNALSIGDAIGQYSSSDAQTSNTDVTATIGQVGQAISSEQTSAYAAAYAALQQIKGILVLNTPSAGFYRVKNVATNGYLYATAASGYTSTDRYVYANGNNSSAETIIQLAEHNGHLYMLTQGHEFGWIAQSSTGSGQVGYVRANGFDKYVNWLPGTAAGQIAFAICYGNGTGDYASYLTQGIYAVDTQDNTVIRGTDYTENAAQWIFETATNMSITLNGPVEDSYYATFCVPFDVTLDDATTAYTLGRGEGTELTISEGSTTVAAGTPVLLVGEGNSATATIGSSYTNAPVSGTALTGNFFAIPFDGTTNYTLGTDGTKVGFYHWNGTTLNANRAYVAGSGSGVKGFVLNFDDDATAIKDLTDLKDSNGLIFNLAGQRISKMQKGINIINGKKIVVK